MDTVSSLNFCLKNSDQLIVTPCGERTNYNMCANSSILRSLVVKSAAPLNQYYY